MTATLSVSSPLDHGNRDGARELRILYALLSLFVIAVVLAVVIWGLPALVLTALALVPVMFIFFVIISRP